MCVMTGTYLFRNIVKMNIRHVNVASLPPGSWLKNADMETVQSVTYAVSAGFNMARNRPEDRRQNALREATFRVPYEVVRFNRDAKDFRVENMGPPPPFSESVISDFADHWPEGTDLFDPQQEARIFLYFPGGATKATAAILAVNGEIEIPDTTKPSAGLAVAGLKKRQLINQAMACWMTQYSQWEVHQPDVLERMEAGSEGKFPVIFVFQDKASGCEWSTSEGRFIDPLTLNFIFGLGAPPNNA